MLAWIPVAAYVIISVVMTRRYFPQFRPLVTPLACDKGILCNYGRGPHYKSGSYRPCYRSERGRELYIDTDAEAVGFAVLFGFGWPVRLIAWSVVKAVTSGNRREQPDELSARIAELERELEMDR